MLGASGCDTSEAKSFEGENKILCDAIISESVETVKLALESRKGPPFPHIFNVCALIKNREKKLAILRKVLEIPGYLSFIDQGTVELFTNDPACLLLLVANCPAKPTFVLCKANYQKFIDWCNISLGESCLSFEDWFKQGKLPKQEGIVQAINPARGLSTQQNINQHALANTNFDMIFAPISFIEPVVAVDTTKEKPEKAKQIQVCSPKSNCVTAARHLGVREDGSAKSSTTGVFKPKRSGSVPDMLSPKKAPKRPVLQEPLLTIAP